MLVVGFIFNHDNDRSRGTLYITSGLRQGMIVLTSMNKEQRIFRNLNYLQISRPLIFFVFILSYVVVVSYKKRDKIKMLKNISYSMSFYEDMKLAYEV